MKSATHKDVHVARGIRIPLRNGLHLSGTLYRPAASEPAPAIAGMTPYIAQSSHDTALSFALHGYPFLMVDIRGRGNSEGEFHPLNDAKDGYDVVEWLAQQPCCNGKVAMWGGSYLGYCQWAVAKEFPPHLVSLVPIASACFGVDFPLRRNVFLPYIVAWLTLIAGRAQQDRMFADRDFWFGKQRQLLETGLPFKQLDTVCGTPISIFQEWTSHPQRGEYWDRYSPSSEEYSRINLPILTITGAYDADQPGALEYYREHMKAASPDARAKHYLIIGPWNHTGCGMPVAEFGGLRIGPNSMLDMRKLHREWYAWTMEDDPKPEFLQKNVAYYVLGAEKWRYADTLPQVTARHEALYLNSHKNPIDVFSSGSLDAQLPASGDCDSYVYDPRDVSLIELESKLDPLSLIDQSMVYAANGKHLIYHSSPFDQDLEVSGFFKLSLWLAIDQPDTDFYVAVYEVNGDGGVLQLTIDWIRARYRETSREARLIDTEDRLQYVFDRFMFVSRLIRKGSRLRLVVGTMPALGFEKNYNGGGVVAEESMSDARVVTIKLYHDSSHPSVLYIPVGPGDSEAQPS